MTRTPEHAKFRLDEILAARPELVPVLMDITTEFLSAETKHNSWPTDAVHASAILGEESGELTQAALDFHYADGLADDDGKARTHMREEAIQCGAMSVRFLLHLVEYQTPACNGHKF